MNTIAVHLYHDSTLSLNLGGDMRNIELERIFCKRYYDWRQESHTIEDILDLILCEQRTFQTGIIVGDRDKSAETLFSRLGVKSIRQVDHHAAHAAAAFYESPYERSLIISYDGGGNDGTFRTFIGTRELGLHALDGGYRLNLGIPYRAIAHPICEIDKPDDGRELSNAGKLMGLAAYGQIRSEWVDPITTYYRECSSGSTLPTEMYRWVLSHLKALGEHMGVDLSRNALTGSEACDLARTAQHVFENLFLEIVLPIASEQRLPICITGGCALNVLTNQRLADSVDVPIFVPPNPNDCGLAQGALLFYLRPMEPVNVTYSGSPIVDLDTLPAVVARYAAVETRPSEIARLLFRGCIVAVMRGNSEHGPRALGNRSILCNPQIPEMKKRLNGRIKFRETFRPYAPVVRRPDAYKYLINAKHDMSFMSFNPTVRMEWRSAIAASIHVDSTARAQTVSREQNAWLFDVLTEFERLAGFGVLLNTSFNSKGRPMVTRIADAIDVFLATDIDCLVIESWLFRKASPSTEGIGPAAK